MNRNSSERVERRPGDPGDMDRVVCPVCKGTGIGWREKRSYWDASPKRKRRLYRGKCIRCLGSGSVLVKKRRRRR